MTLGNMRHLGVQRLVASCLNDACRDVALIDVSSYPADTEVPYFRSRVVCAKCGSKGNKIDVRPNGRCDQQQSCSTKYSITATLINPISELAAFFTERTSGRAWHERRPV
jgi:hypothetical protein